LTLILRSYLLISFDLQNQAGLDLPGKRNKEIDMDRPLIKLHSDTDFSKEFGPLVVALAWVLAVGGISAAAIIVCGWGHVKSASINWSKWSAEIVCR